MKAGTSALFLVLLSGVCHCQYPIPCQFLTNAPKPIEFPNIKDLSPIAYQVEVEVTISNQKQTDYFIEYYTSEGQGRVDYFHDSGVTEKYYYYTEGFEAFEISEKSRTCEERNESNIPEFMKLGMSESEWYFKDDKEIVHGPSAMFRNAYLYRKDTKKMAYMGVSEPVRGIPAHYWRRCLQPNLTADYYFSIGKREGIFGLKDVTSIPLRIQIFGVDADIPEGSKTLYPQSYEFMTFTPYLQDPYYTFELPVGWGCGRKPREDDNEIPTFGQQSLYVEAEVIYTDNTAGGISYSSDFTFAYDIESGYLSYFYTPWAKSGGDMEADAPIYVVYDTKNKYVYNTTYKDGKCSVGGIAQFLPKYSLPGGNKGFIYLTSPEMFYPNDEFSYLGKGKDRGYKVDIFEAFYPEGFLLGDRVVKNTIVTHYYLESGELKEGPRIVEEALTRIRISFNDTENKMNGVLNFHLYDFTTAVDQKSINFYIGHCFRDEDDIMFVTVGFTAGDADLDLVKDDMPSAVQNARSFIKEVTDLPAARIPGVFIEFREALYATFVIIERAPFALDFDNAKENTYISGAAETQGITSLADCAYLCLESELECWGFAHCGAICYVGGGERSKAKLEQKTGCTYYNPTSHLPLGHLTVCVSTNFNIVPRLKVVRRNLERAVQRGQPTMSVFKKDEGVMTFTPKYIEDANFDESEGAFDLIGLETSNRLRVVKIGAKLTADTGEKLSKNFGALTYGECQSFCLEFKACETISYCASSGECVLSLTHAEDIPANKFVEDNMCNVLTRKYADAFTRSPGDTLSQSAKKVIDTSSEEDCAKACMKESSFECLSFDSCRSTDGKGGCRLHSVHILDLKDDEAAVKKESICGHYSRKYTYDFKRQSKRKAVGSGFVLATGITHEQCAKYCLEYSEGQCNGFDLCMTKESGSSSCVGLLQKVSDMKTTYNEMCEHYERAHPITIKRTDTGSNVSYGVAGGVGFLLFVIGCALGALILYGIAYYRVNRPR